MLKKFFLMMIGVCVAASLQAQTAKECFLAIPDSLLPLLTEVNRADFIDFLESDMKAETSNRLGGKSEMTRLTDDYIAIRLTPQSTWQMKLLPLKADKKVICVVTTVEAPAADSYVRFYTTDWRPLSASKHLAKLPVMTDFLPALPADSLPTYATLDARRQADILFLRADLSPTEQTLTFTLTTPDYMEKSAAEQLAPSLRSSLVYLWEKKKFRLQKSTSIARPL